MSIGFLTLAYLVAGAFFILSLGGLSQQETASRGNNAGILGMFVALAATLFHPDAGGLQMSLLAIGIGAVVGLRMAQTVAMTQMPQLVAILHSFVGLAAVLVGLSTFWEPLHPMSGTKGLIHALEVYADVTIGAITFAGSVVAWAKLDGRMSGKPMLLPGRHQINLGMVAALAVLALLTATLPGGMFWLVLAAVVSAVLGAHLVLAIGGADMPVVVSLLNSYSGWTAAAAGFMLANDLLIITGALVGSSGAILSYIMCKAMNRSIWNVVFGGFGTDDAAKPAPAATDGPTEVHAIEADGLKDLLDDAKDVVIIPGYGMAVARAQNAVKSFVDELQKRGTTVRFAIHPVAGRLPGHMNVLLAEAGVSYDIVHEMEDINDDLPESDVALVIGANDIVNPGAQTDTSSPIYGMPVLEAWKARHVVVLKRGMSSGYAGVGNPLFFKDNTHMLFGDAKASMDDVVAQLRN
jgi:NAD(P) transhydrogenase subunit beta